MLKFVQVTKKFFDEPPALVDISFKIKEGELVVITGASGSGKTTLLKLLTKEYEPTSGEIYFGESLLGNLKKQEIPYHRRKIGAVFQDYKLLPELNIWENIALALSILGGSNDEIESKVTELLELVGLTSKAFLFPHQLSGGEAQRVSIARALSTAPKVIFADEPTGNLDSENSLIIAKLLKKINELGTTVLVTTHDPVVVKTLSGFRTMVLKNGTLIDSEPEDADAKPEAKEEKPKKAKPESDLVPDSEQKPDSETKLLADHVADTPIALSSTVATPPKKSWGFFGIFKHKAGAPAQEKVEEEKTVEPEVEEPKASVEKTQIHQHKDKKSASHQVAKK